MSSLVTTTIRRTGGQEVIVTEGYDVVSIAISEVVGSFDGQPEVHACEVNLSRQDVERIARLLNEWLEVTS